MFLFIFFSVHPSLSVYVGEKEKKSVYETKKKNWHTDLSAITVYVCNAFGSLNNMRCYYLKKTVHRRERDFYARALYELKGIPESIVNVLFTVLKPLQYCRSREGTEMDASTRQQ